MSWENDLPPEYKPDFKKFGGNKSQEFKKHCFAKHCWQHRNEIAAHTGVTWSVLFKRFYGETVDDYRSSARAIAAKRAAEAFNQQPTS